MKKHFIQKENVIPRRQESTINKNRQLVPSEVSPTADNNTPSKTLI